MAVSILGKENQRDDTGWPENTENMQFFVHLRAVFGSVRIYLYERRYFFSFSPTMGKRRLACDVFDLFTIHCSLVHDITTGHKMAALMCMSLCFPVKSHLQITGCFTVKCKNVKRQV